MCPVRCRFATVPFPDWTVHLPHVGFFHHSARKWNLFFDSGLWHQCLRTLNNGHCQVKARRLSLPLVVYWHSPSSLLALHNGLWNRNRPSWSIDVRFCSLPFPKADGNLLFLRFQDFEMQGGAHHHILMIRIRNLFVFDWIKTHQVHFDQMMKTKLM